MSKQAEAQMWKQKYENQISQMVQIKANYEYEIKSLSNQLSKMHAENEENHRNRQQSNQNAVEESKQRLLVNEYRKHNETDRELYEEQIKRLQSQVEEKSNQVLEQTSKFERMRCNYESDEIKWKNEIEQLNLKISSLETQHQLEINQIRQKYEFYNQNQYKNVFDAHSNQIDMMEQDISKLRQLIDIKNSEIETLLQQNAIQKEQSEEKNQQLREEIVELKQKLKESYELYELDCSDSYQSYEKKLEQQQSMLRNYYEGQLNNLVKELDYVKRQLDQKKEEVNKLEFDKNLQKNTHEQEKNKLQQDIEQLRYKQEQTTQEKQKEIIDLQIRLERLNQNYKEMEGSRQFQIENYEREIYLLKEKEQDIRNEFQRKQEQQENYMNELRRNIDELNFKIKDISDEQSKGIEYVLENNKHKQDQLFERVSELEHENKLQYEQISTLREQLNIRCHELDNQINICFELENQIIILKDENEKLLLKLRENEEIQINEIQNVKRQLQEQNEFQLDSLKMAYNQQYSVIQQELNDLRAKLASKQRQYVDLLENYQKMERLGNSLTNSRYSRK